MFHIDSGSLHHIENGADVAEFIIAFRSERPEDFGLGAAFGAMTDAVLGNTYALDASDFAGIRRDTSDRAVVARIGDPVVSPAAYFSDGHKFAVEEQNPTISLAVGSAHLARVQFWPALKDLSMYPLGTREDGMREPHWHPITAEMGYVHQGSARMTVMHPDGSLDTWYLEEGDVYFIPRAYPHHIEVVGSEDIHFLIFCDQPTAHRSARTPAKFSPPRSTPTSTICRISRHVVRPAHRHPHQPARRTRRRRVVEPHIRSRFKYGREGNCGVWAHE